MQSCISLLLSGIGMIRCPMKRIAVCKCCTHRQRETDFSYTVNNDLGISKGGINEISEF